MKYYTRVLIYYSRYTNFDSNNCIIHLSEVKVVGYLSYDMILHGKDGNIVFNDDWYSDGMQDWVVIALPQLMGTVTLFPKFRTHTKHITLS